MAATGGFGVEFYIGNGMLSSTPDYTLVGKVEDISSVGGKSIMDEITAHDSPGGYREKIASGLMEVDDIDLTLVHDLTQTTQANASGGLFYTWQNRIPLAYKIVLPDDMTWEFDAYISEWRVDSLKDKAMRSSLKLTITGQPVIS